MIWLATRTYKLSELRLPDDWEARLASARKGELAAAIKQTSGPINQPVIEDATGEIVCGVDRIAGIVVGGATSFLGRGWVGSPAEKLLVRASENAHRRPNESERWLPQYLAAIRALREEQRGELSPAPGVKSRGREKSEETLVREDAAQRLGVTPQAIRRREERIADKLERDTEPQDASESPLPVSAAPKPPTLKARIRNVLHEVQEIAPVVQGFVDETEERAMRADAARTIKDNPNDPSVGLLHIALRSARSALEDVEGQLKAAMGEIERIESALRAADGPRTGLGGRKLRG